LDLVYHRFTEIADRKKGLRNDEILSIARETLNNAAKAVFN